MLLCTSFKFGFFNVSAWPNEVTNTWLLVYYKSNHWWIAVPVIKVIHLNLNKQVCCCQASIQRVDEEARGRHWCQPSTRRSSKSGGDQKKDYWIGSGGRWLQVYLKCKYLIYLFFVSEPVNDVFRLADVSILLLWTLVFD